VVLPQGDLATGRHVLQVELTPVGGEPLRIDVQGGTIARIPFVRGQRGTLRIRPADGVRIGPNAPGAEVLSDEAAISGSMLGVIVDARPRPLELPTDIAERSTLMWDWLAALGVPRSVDGARPTAPETIPITAATADSIPVSPEPIAEPVDADAPAAPVIPPQEAQAAPLPASPQQPPDSYPPQQPAPQEATPQEMIAQNQDTGIQDELHAIRQELIEPPAQPKRGFFRRRS
jgi:hypothetical protein